MLTGKAKTDYQREYMRRRRADAKAANVARNAQGLTSKATAQGQLPKGLTAGLTGEQVDMAIGYAAGIHEGQSKSMLDRQPNGIKYEPAATFAEEVERIALSRGEQTVTAFGNVVWPPRGSNRSYTYEQLRLAWLVFNPADDLSGSLKRDFTNFKFRAAKHSDFVRGIIAMSANLSVTAAEHVKGIAAAYAGLTNALENATDPDCMVPLKWNVAVSRSK